MIFTISAATKVALVGGRTPFADRFWVATILTLKIVTRLAMHTKDGRVAASIAAAVLFTGDTDIVTAVASWTKQWYLWRARLALRK